MSVSVYILLLCAVSLPLCMGSLYDPHLFPQKGPFFEGWYLRITDATKTDSLGILFGSVLPQTDADSSTPLVVVSILRRNCSRPNGSCNLISVDGEFDINHLNITVNGKYVSRNPDRKSPSNFRWEVNSGSQAGLQHSGVQQGGYFEQSGNKTNWVFKIGDLLFRGQADEPHSWDPSGSGPEGWLSYLPLPLHWFVFSLRSRLVSYDIQNVTSGEVSRGCNGVVHMEKNWGKSFPRSWIWSEGVSTDNSNASYAVSGGLVDILSLSIPAYLIGYRNPATGTVLNFRPDNSLVDTKIDGCRGIINMTVTGLSYRLRIVITAQPNSFSSCLLGPEVRGFTRACVESYDATASFSVFKRTFILFEKFGFMEEHSFKHAALEFGGLNVCNHACSSSNI